MLDLLTPMDAIRHQVFQLRENAAEEQIKVLVDSSNNVVKKLKYPLPVSIQQVVASSRSHWEIVKSKTTPVFLCTTAELFEAVTNYIKRYNLEYQVHLHALECRPTIFLLGHHYSNMGGNAIAVPSLTFVFDTPKE